MVVVTGEGRGFCAGADLAGGGDTFDWRERQSGSEIPRDGGGELTLRLFESTKPLIAAINGPAVGVGATMTLPMDIRLAADGRAHGLRLHPPRDRARGVLELVPATPRRHRPSDGVGGKRAASSGAEEALAGGLVRSVHPADELLDAAYDLAREIADNTAPVSVALARRLMWTMLGAGHPMEAHRADSRAMFARGQSEDAREGVTSFLEKRPAHFSDRVSDGLPDVFPGAEAQVFE